MLAKERERILYEIASMQKLYDMVQGDSIMELPFRQKIDELRSELNAAEEVKGEARATIYFFGGPVIGSLGIDAEFVSDSILPFQQMVSARVSSMFRKVAKKGRIRRIDRSKLYLTSLPRGSFGIELRKLENLDLFDGNEVVDSINSVVDLISATKDRDALQEKSIQASGRELSALKKFFSVLKKSNAGLAVETDVLNTRFSQQEVIDANYIISEVIIDTDEIQIMGRFTGVFLESRTFEFLTNTDQKITGNIHPDIDDAELDNYVQKFLDVDCIGTFEKITRNQIEGEGKPQYRLLALDELNV